MKSSQESWDSRTIITLTVFCGVQTSPATLLKVAQVVNGDQSWSQACLTQVFSLFTLVCFLPPPDAVLSLGQGPLDEVEGELSEVFATRKLQLQLGR